MSSKHRKQLRHREEGLLHALEGSRGTGGDDVVGTLNRAAERSRATLVIAAGFAAFAGPPGRRAAARGIGCELATALLANAVIKPAVGRTRPTLRLRSRARLLRRSRQTKSFPSTHAAGVAAFATGAGAELPAARWPLAALAAAVGYTPLHMGMHYPSDVAVGWALGAAVGRASRWLVTVGPRAAGDHLGHPHAAGDAAAARPLRGGAAGR